MVRGLHLVDLAERCRHAPPMSFPTTRWTLLAEATLAGDSHGQKALDDLCKTYRVPIEAFLRSQGLPKDEIEDVVQDFFLGWLRSRSWKRADRVLGRFRTFLLGGVMHTLAHYRSRKSAQKRGGGMEPHSLDLMAESGIEPACPSAAETSVFDREWAEALVAGALAELAKERATRGKAGEFEVLRHFLPGATETLSFEAAAERLGIKLDATKVAIHRLRDRFRVLIRSAVASTVSAPHEVEEELQYLRSLLLGGPKGGTQPHAEGKTDM